MRACAAAIGVVLAACVGGIDGADGAPPGAGGDGPACSLSLEVDPLHPIAGPSSVIRVIAHSNVAGVLGYDWHVQASGGPIATTPARADGGAIEFFAPQPGVYVVSLAVSGAMCSTAIVPINVAAPGALSEFLRLRVVSPRSAAAPPLERMVEIKGGADADLGIVGIDSGVLASPQVTGPAGGMPAYLQFSPGGTPDAIVEAFSDASGATAVQLAAVQYAVLVVPSVAGVAPRRITGWSPGMPLALDAGTPITGVVLDRDAASTPLPGATVRLSVDGVPSTVATTAAVDGSFALLAATGAAGASVTVEVTPPAGSGLPRLSATSRTFDLRAALQIRYSSNLALTDLAGTVVRRQAVPVAGARVTVVGTLPTAGLVTAGVSAVASGEVRIAAVADAAGALPAMRVPSEMSSISAAVIEVAPGDLAVAALEVSAGPPAGLDAPPPQLVTTAVLDAGHAALSGATLELVPTGALAMVGAPVLRFAAGSGGVIAAMLPAGARYQLRLVDPMGRAAPLIVADRAITAIAPSYALPAAVHLQGTLRRDATLALPGASVQVLCQACTGIERAMPLAEVVSDAAGRFRIAVPDPGTR